MTSLKMCSFTTLTLTASISASYTDAMVLQLTELIRENYYPSANTCRFPLSVHSKTEGKKQRPLHIEVFSTFTSSKQVCKNHNDVRLRRWVQTFEMQR